MANSDRLSAGATLSGLTPAIWCASISVFSRREPIFGFCTSCLRGGPSAHLGRAMPGGLCWGLKTSGYNLCMMDEGDFRKRADAALDSLKKSLMEAEESAQLEVEDQSGALHVSFEDRSKFVISPNAAVRQIWISALATSFKLDWSDAEQNFVLSKTGEKLKPLIARLINQQLGEELVTLT